MDRFGTILLEQTEEPRPIMGKLIDRPSRKYDPDTTPFEVYEMAKKGMSDTDISSALGVNNMIFARWKKERPPILAALKKGRKGTTNHMNAPTFKDYVLENLPPHLTQLWEEINEADDLDNRIEYIESLLSRHGLRARQHLFLYALTANLFNISRACRLVNVSRRTFQDWVRNDPDFGELIDEVHQIKKDYVEHGLMDLIRMRDSKAIIFANKTFNKDRGYGEHVTIEQKGDNRQPIDELDLDLETRKKILAAMREKNQKTIEAQDVKRIAEE